MNIIIKTIGLFYKSIGKKALLIGDELDSHLDNFIFTNNKYLENYDFYIYLNKKPENTTNNNILVLSEIDIKIENFNIIKDSFVIPKNIVFLENDEDLFSQKFIYSKKLPLEEKISIQKTLNTMEKIYSTKDILVIL